MLAVYKQIAHAADAVAPVLIIGESGTGKELVARAHPRSTAARASAFVAINCGAIAETLLESELFGHVRGAFTGAIADRRASSSRRTAARCSSTRSARRSPALQVKLLRVLEEGEVRPVGAAGRSRSTSA